jgi:HEAT repeat protein
MDSGYVQGVIIRVMAQTIPVDQLRKAVATEHDQAIRLRLTVAAGMAGDKEVAPALLALLKSDEDGFLRVASAEALAGAPDASLMDAFKTALADRYSQISVTDVGPDHGEYKVYPVRLIAASALRRLGQEVPAGTVLSTPLQGESEAQTLSLLLDDKDPEVCLSAVEMLSGRGADAVPLLRKFVLSNSVDPALAASVAEARRAVGDSNTARGD